MKLIYDIAVMAQLVAACQSANTEIAKAEQLVQQVRSHSDWTCKEKSVIDELMQDCKTLVQRMREDQSAFLQVLKEVEGELNDTENSVSNLFSGVESILGKVLGIPVAQTVAIGGGLLGVGSAVSGIGNKIGSIIGDPRKNGLVDIVPDVTTIINSGTVGTDWAGDWIENLKDIGEDIADTELIWPGPGVLGGIGGIANGVITGGIGIGGKIADGIADTWHEAWENNPNLPHGRISDVGTGLPSRMTEWYQERIQSSMEQATGGMIDHIQDTTEDFVEMAQQVAQISGTTAYPHGQLHPEVTGVLKDALENWGDAVAPIVSPVSEVVSDVWSQVQDSTIGDAMQDALRNITENIAICRMDDLKL